MRVPRLPALMIFQGKAVMRLSGWWRQRSLREKQGLAVALVLLLSAALFLLLEPVVGERRRLSAELPQLRDDLAWMRAHVADIKRLRTRAVPVTEGSGRDVSLTQVETLLLETGLRRLVGDMRPLAERGLRINFNEVGFSDLLEFIFRLQDGGYGRVAGTRVNRVEGRDGLVTAELTLLPH